MQRLNSIYFGPSILGGRGIFASEQIGNNSLIEICPMIVCPVEDMEYINKTKLYDYYFLWGDNEDHLAIALGFGSLYNHSAYSNAKYLVDEQNKIMQIWTIKSIKINEEITVNYNGDPSVNKKVWFEDKSLK